MDDELLLRARTLTAAAQVIAQQLENTKITSNNDNDNDNDNDNTSSPERLKQHNHHVHFKNPEEVEDKSFSWKGACIKGSSLITTFTDIRPYCPRGSTIMLGGYSYSIAMEGDYNASRVTLSSDFIQDTNLDCTISISGNELEHAKKRTKKVIKRDMQPVSTSAIQSAVQDLDYITNMKAMRNDENNQHNKFIRKVKVKEVNNNRTQSAPSVTTGLINSEYINQDDNDYNKRDIKDTIAYKMSSYEEMYTRKDVVDSKVQREKAAKRVLNKMKEDKLKKMQEEKDLIEKNERIRAESELKAKVLRERTLKRLAEKKTVVESNPQINTETEEEKQKQMAEKMANLELKAKRCRNETRKRLELIKAQDREKEKSRMLGIEKKLREISEAKKVSIPTRYAMGQNPREKSPNSEVISMKLRDDKNSIAAEYDVMYGSEEDDDVCKNLEIDRDYQQVEEVEDDDMNLSVDSIEANTRNIRADSLTSVEDNDNVGYLRNHVYGAYNANDESNISNGPSSPSSELTSSPSRITEYSGQTKDNNKKKKIKKYKRLPVIPMSVPYIPIPVSTDLR